MKKVVVYFHGYASSARTQKVEDLRSLGFDTYAYDVEDFKNPEHSIEKIADNIGNMLTGYVPSEIKLVFVGTSMGAWYASELAMIFGVKELVLVNPCFEPELTLSKLGFADEDAEKYLDMVFRETDIVFLGSEDELIDFSTADFNGATVLEVEGADHRFARPWFDLVMAYVEAI